MPATGEPLARAFAKLDVPSRRARAQMASGRAGRLVVTPRNGPDVGVAKALHARPTTVGRTRRPRAAP